MSSPRLQAHVAQPVAVVHAIRQVEVVRDHDQRRALLPVQVMSSAATTSPDSWSRLPVGSSHNTRPGRCTSARASATRCFSPPDSSCGRWWSLRRESHLLDEIAGATLDVVAPRRGTRASAPGRSRAPNTAAAGDGPGTRSRRGGCGTRPGEVVQLERVLPVEQDRSGRGRFERAEDVEERALAAAGRADDRHGFSGGDGEVDLRQHVDRPSGRRVVFRYVSDLEHVSQSTADATGGQHGVPGAASRAARRGTARQDPPVERLPAGRNAVG